ncbi:hypothetical protein B0H17DRAFT_1057118 [Mycena rosella]|uniref:Uncharacterized protein n=1 Tax=Mycena rosella TaxID=1033263 RepID=A0AAD7DM40_MYCRO|nr:hypothetical protein B0H17DRAFT_1057118 [Mycena rosella]
MAENKSLQRAEALWFSSEVVILQADTRIFCVFAAILKAQSSVFADMFTFSQPGLLQFVHPKDLVDRIRGRVGRPWRNRMEGVSDRRSRHSICQEWSTFSWSRRMGIRIVRTGRNAIACVLNLPISG